MSAPNAERCPDNPDADNSAIDSGLRVAFCGECGQVICEADCEQDFRDYLETLRTADARVAEAVEPWREVLAECRDAITGALLGAAGWNCDCGEQCPNHNNALKDALAAARALLDKAGSSEPSTKDKP